MTANHLLIYRLAELMLESQQHVLAVDGLFEDEQIGEFVKSIQIDSPYQQMLLEDVLTETVKEHKLYVTFTVEGYFHYVLGEVIFQQAEGKSPEFLKDIIENNKLNGALEGLEQCLIRDVENDDLSRLMWLIDEGGASLDACSLPLAHAFLQVKGNPQTDEELEDAQRLEIKRVLSELLADPTDNDIVILDLSIGQLEMQQKSNELSEIFKSLNTILSPVNEVSLKLLIKSLHFVAPRRRNQYKVILLNWINGVNLTSGSHWERNLYLFKPTPSVIIGFAHLLNEFGEYENTHKILQKKNFVKFKFSMEDKVNYYDLLGDTYNLKRIHSKALINYQNCLEAILEFDNSNSVKIAECYQNIATIEFLQNGTSKRVLKLFQKALNIISESLGVYSATYAFILINYARILSQSNNACAQKEIELLIKAIQVNTNLISVNCNQNKYALCRLFEINAGHMSEEKFEWILNCLEDVYLRIDIIDDSSDDSESALLFGGWFRTFISKKFNSIPTLDIENYISRCLNIEGFLYNKEISESVSNKSLNFECGVILYEKGDFKKAFNFLTKAARYSKQEEDGSADFEAILEYLEDISINDRQLRIPKF